MLADAVGRLLGDLVTPEALARAEERVWPAALWDALESSGLVRPLVSEAQGGAGGGWAEAWVLVHAAGRHGAPVPLAETIVAGWLVEQVGLDVPDGPLTLVPDASRLRIAGDRVTGEAARVPWGDAAAHVVVVGEGRLALVPRPAVRVTPGANLAREPRDGLRFDDAPATVASLAGLPADVVRRTGALVRAAQIAGGLETLLAASVRYANERVQFGRPIGKFQAIQQQLAVLAEHAAAATMAAEVAFAAMARGEAALETAVAKVRCGEAAEAGATIAHAVHGAIGFTYEHVLQFTTRRLWSWRAEFGGESAWAAALGRAVAARGADALWADLTGPG
jgi:acyl-CoA dehydrogenase